MTTPAFRLAKNVQEKLRLYESTNALLMHNFGRRVDTMLRSKELYGEDGVILLGEYLGFNHRDYLLKLLDFVQAFSRKYVERTVGLAFDNDRYLTLEHFLEIAGIESEGDRRELMGRTLSDGLSPGQLRRDMRMLRTQRREPPSAHQRNLILPTRKSRKSKLPSPEERSAIFDKMSPKTRRIAERFDRKFKIVNRGKALVFYDVGKLISLAVVREATYGSDAIERIGALMRHPGGKTNLYTWRNLSCEYTRDEVEDEATTPMANGLSISVDHLTKAMSAKTGTRKFLARAREECLTPEELGQIIRPRS